MVSTESAEKGNVEYVLGRDYLASARLNLQHYLLTQDVGYLVHPSITLKPGMKVADVATGTGVWMIDLAPKNPDVEFHGFDVDLAQAPPTEWLPSNVKLDVMDLFKPVPEELVGQFDYVHTRLLMFVVRENPVPILEKLMKLLKPGGVLQWVEMDHPTHRFEKTRPEYSYTYFSKAATFPNSLQEEDTRLDPKWVSELASHYRCQGLEVLADEHKYRDKYHLAYYCDPAFMAWEEIKQGMKPSDGAQYSDLIGKGKQEMAMAKRGIAINMEIRTVVGRKPL